MVATTYSGSQCLRFRRSMEVADKTYEEVLDMIEAYGFERILEDGEMNKPEVLMLLDELGFLELEMYDDDYC